MLNDNHDDLAIEEEMARAFARSGYKPAVARGIELLKERSTHTYVDPGVISIEYGFLGDKEQTFQWLEKAFAEKSEQLALLRSLRCYDFLRSDPRYVNLEKRIGLPQ